MNLAISFLAIRGALPSANEGHGYIAAIPVCATHLRIVGDTGLDALMM